MKTIDATPTWLGLLPMMLELYAQFDKAANSKKATQKDNDNWNASRAEFKKMAIGADNWNAHCKELQSRVITVDGEETTIGAFMEANTQDGNCNLPDGEMDIVFNLRIGEEVELGGGSSGTYKVCRMADRLTDEG